MNILKYTKSCVKAFVQMPYATDFIIQTMDAKSSHNIFMVGESVSSQMVMQVATLAKLKAHMPVPCTNEEYAEMMRKMFISALEKDGE